MTLPLLTDVYDVSACWVFPLLTDLAGAASPTYGAGVHVPGIAAVTVDPTFVSAQLKGDGGQVLDTRSKITSESVSFTYDFVALDALSVMQGGSVASHASGRVSQGWGITYGAPSVFFGMAVSLEDVATDTGIQAVNLYFYKCTLTGGERLNAATEKFTQPTGTFDSFSCRSNIAFDSFTELLAVPDSVLTMQAPYSS